MDFVIKYFIEKDWTLPFFFLAIFMTILAISSQSLWIDEGITTWFAFQETFTDVISTIKNTDMAESLMPGYIIYMWAWVKTFGISEYSLRLSNLPFIITVLFLFTKLPVSRVFRNTLILLTCLSPFLWVYLNEVRSYIALFSFSAIGLSGLLFYFYGDSTLKKIGPYLTVFGLLIGSFFNISTGFTIAALIPTAIFMHRQTKNNQSNFLLDWKRPVLYAIPFFVVLGGFYLKVILAGSGGRLQASAGEPTLKNIAFCFYEFLGFSGIGPPRNILRANPSIETFSPYWLWLGFAVLILTAALVYAIILYRKSDREIRFLKDAYLWGFLCGFLTFCVFAFTFKFVFYGRHVIFLYPFFIFAVAFMVKEIWSKKNRLMLRYILIVSILFIFLVSGLRLRFDPAYFKDDYRSAASTALSLANNDEPIFWAADLSTGAYYGLEYDNTDFNRPLKIKPIRKVYAAANWSIEEIKEHIRSFESVILVLSKKDTFDEKNGWSNFIAGYNAVETASYNAFKIYKFKL